MTRQAGRLSLGVVAILSGVVASLFAQQTLPQAGQIRVLSSNGVKVAIKTLRPEIEERIGRSLSIEFNTAASLKTRIEAGEDFDVAILTPALIDELVEQDRIAADSRLEFARTGVGVGAHVNAPASDVSSLETFKRVLLNADSVAFTADGQSRRTIDRVFERLAITDAMQARTLLMGPGQGPTAVAAGEADLVLTLVSEIVSVPGLQLLGTFPDEVQGYVSFAAGHKTRLIDADSAAALIQYLTQPAFIAALEASGLDAVRPRALTTRQRF